jgi:hypothetical protein
MRRLAPALLLFLAAPTLAAPPAPISCDDLAAPIVGKPYHLARAVLIMAGHRPVIPKPAMRGNDAEGLSLLFRFAANPTAPNLAALMLGGSKPAPLMDDAYALGYLETTGPSSQGSAWRSFAWQGHGFKYQISANGCEDLTDPTMVCTVRKITCH